MILSVIIFAMQLTHGLPYVMHYREPDVYTATEAGINTGM